MLAEVIFQCVERAVPVAHQRGQELLRHLHRRRPQPVPHPAPLPGSALTRPASAAGPVLGGRLPGDRQPARG